MSARAAGSTFFQPSKAFQAAATASSTSCLVASAQVARSSPLAGQVVWNVPPSEAGRHWPSM